ncbi:predicted protein [Histoplasma mississippiense (nom. inval.)]|uniref:predicted protein n=1 Tax=Ajellomyces capsulatus (strain NAm1 / WU24) TaxID=2059318 RepID=UPI000157D23A|nr:predicted protein [Histoplasma mississippiense (nom. inval.)]EDN04612.1 predicted protein [Histoplasma mississippiense (nom. inval.)]
MLAREYQKEAQASLNTKSVTTFNGTNYQMWKMAFLSDAEVIGGADILNKNQQKPPEGSVRLTMGSIQPDNAAALWNKDGSGSDCQLRYQQSHKTNCSLNEAYEG